MLSAARLHRPEMALIGLSLALAIIAVVFMTYDAKGSWDFVLAFRGRKLWGMALAGAAIATSTVLFQTITNNRILSPAIMGFDWLYRLIQTVLVFVLGSITLNTLNGQVLFVMEAGVMVIFALILFRVLFTGSTKDLHFLVLTGVVFGLLFSSLADFMQRLIDPNEFVILQDRTFARFTAIEESLLVVSTLVIGAAVAIAFVVRRRLDVIALGQETAINLGIDFKRFVDLILVLIAVLVAVSTALVGPVTFFGLLVANLAYQITGTYRHGINLPVAIVLAVLSLVGGQMVLEEVFAFDTSLSIVIEFIGGIVFIILLLRGNGR